ncbi:DUF973 family protein [Vulcanisaeta sp. JCM 16159]|uniref:DUF973 family protein n=1 Tax=Vulcanisaeta sp. JCM 16159 TaxID=1295371 RepID=UPI0006D2A204|nr:DUF973 family protein [Vulcanisaeta sp. JCM 16159]
MSGQVNQRLIFIYNGVSRIQTGINIGVMLGIIYGIALLVINLLGSMSIEAMIRGYGILQVAEVAVGLPVLYHYMYRGFNELTKADSARYGIGRLGVILLLVISPLLLAEGLYFILVDVSQSIFLLLRVVDSVVALVIYVLILVALYRLGSEFNVDHLRIGAILVIVSAVILVTPNILAAIIGLVGVVLTITGIGEVKRVVEEKIKGM